MARILVADDDCDVVDTLSVVLKFHGFEVFSARDGRAALTLVRDAQPDAVILEVVLPGLDGFDVLRRMRAERMDAPTLFLSTQDSLHDKLTGLTLGADDYMTKPFSPEELIARLRVTLRRGKTVARVERNARMTFADIELDQESQEAWKAGRPVPLSPTEFRLLRCFVTNAGKVLRKPEILELVWGQPVGRDVTTVETYISRLRRKIETRDEPLLHTLRGVGYMLREPY